MLWECDKGHRWETPLSIIRSAGCWCPHCKKVAKLTIDMAHKVAHSKNGKCLSKRYINNRKHLTWQCENKHVWKASLGCIKNLGTWCPECYIFNNQKKLQLILEDVLGVKAIANFKEFDWLKTGRKPQEIDIWFKKLKLAVEYDGEQHFKPVCFGGISKERAKENFKKQKKRDKIKNNLIKKHTDDVKFFIRFGYTEPITEDYIRKKLQEFGILNI